MRAATGRRTAVDVARRQRADPRGPGRLQMVDAARAELHGQLDPTSLRELVRVQAKREAGFPAGLEVLSRLPDVERPSLDEHIGRLGKPRSFREDLGEHEVEVRVAVGELGRNCMGAQEGRHPSRPGDSTELGELGVPVEAVAGFPLEGRGSVREHPAPMALDKGLEGLLAGLSGRTHRGQDAAAGSVELLVRGAARAQLEFRGPIAGEARVGMAVDEPRDDRPPSPVQVHDLRRQRGPVELAHGPDRDDPSSLAEHVGVLDDADVPERRSAQRPVTWRG